MVMVLWNEQREGNFISSVSENNWILKYNLPSLMFKKTFYTYKF